jgi:carbon monoxide dehydrogenase subunit G
VCAALAAAALAPAARGAEEALATAEVAETPEAVWAVLSDFASWERVFPAVANLEVDRIDERRVRLHTRTRVAGRLVRYTLAATVDADAHRIDCALDRRAPTDVVALESSWRVHETPAGGARIELLVRSESGFALPGFVERRIAELSTRQSVDALVAALSERRVALAAAD